MSHASEHEAEEAGRNDRRDHEPNRPHYGLPIQDRNVSATKEEEELAGTEDRTYIRKPVSTAVDSQRAIDESQALRWRGVHRMIGRSVISRRHRKRSYFSSTPSVDLPSTVPGRHHVPHREEA